MHIEIVYPYSESRFCPSQRYYFGCPLLSVYPMGRRPKYTYQTSQWRSAHGRQKLLRTNSQLHHDHRDTVSPGISANKRIRNKKIAKSLLYSGVRNGSSGAPRIYAHCIKVYVGGGNFSAQRRAETSNKNSFVFSIRFLHLKSQYIQQSLPK